MWELWGLVDRLVMALDERSTNCRDDQLHDQGFDRDGTGF